MGKIIAAERQKEILKLLHDNGSVKIGQLAEYFKYPEKPSAVTLLILLKSGLHREATEVQLPFMNLAISQLKQELTKMLKQRLSYAKKH